MQRRRFFRSSGLLAGGFLLSRLPVIAGPFTAGEFGLYAPPDKRLDPAWVKSLFERGVATSYRRSKNELRYIGMPVGGIGCGNVYVGGDGRLWLWDIFNQKQLGVITKELDIALEGFNAKKINNVHGSLYIEPLTVQSPFQQGFAVRIGRGERSVLKRLHHEDWEEIVFEATYPVATIRYTDKNFPLQVELKAFSPFIPGDEDNSSLPVTVQSLRLENVTGEKLDVEILGWLENNMLPFTGKEKNEFTRVNRKEGTPNCKGFLLAAETGNGDIIQAADFGNMAFASLSKGKVLSTSVNDSGLKDHISEEKSSPVAVLSQSVVALPKQAVHADFLISWYVPNLSFKEISDSKRYYANQFSNAWEVAVYTARNYTSLKKQTLLFHTSWYGGTLPWWFLERTFVNTSILATSTCFRLKSGRFYAWEGVGCCAGTCTHVWQYAQAAARIFPALERDTRERVDLGLSLQADGGMWFRGEADKRPAIDGQAGTILRIFREHQMSADDSFLRKNWEKIRLAIGFIIAQDKNRDGMEDTPIENTLDAIWSGEIAWIVGLCLAAVRAGEEMATEMQDTAFAATCREYVEKGKRNMEQALFNGEYFIHRPDPKEGKSKIGSYNTCHIDQVYGQSWAFQVGLDRVLDKDKTISALRALWKYNFMPDVGPYIAEHKGGRFYALAGEGGMVMNTNPSNEEKPYGEAKAWQMGYFSECMTGFEHQVAAHMMAEGMVEESFVLTRMIHDRYHAARRNPFNEIECSDHYARAMASYGSFISACGFRYHGPKKHMGFAPMISPADFKSAFISAEGWGTYSQQRNDGSFSAGLQLLHGKLSLNSFAVELSEDHKASSVKATVQGKNIPCSFVQIEKQVRIHFEKTAYLLADQLLSFIIA